MSAQLGLDGGGEPLSGRLLLFRGAPSRELCPQIREGGRRNPLDSEQYLVTRVVGLLGRGDPMSHEGPKHAGAVQVRRVADDGITQGRVRAAPQAVRASARRVPVLMELGRHAAMMTAAALPMWQLLTSVMMQELTTFGP